MTVLPSSGGPHLDATDGHFVAQLANDIFREAPGLTGPAATQVEDFDAVPGHAANAATDRAAAVASSAYRVNPALADSMPFGDVPHAAPGALGTGASSPSSFMLRSAPLGDAVPADIVEPWRSMADPTLPIAPRGSLTQVPYTGGPMTSEAPAVHALRQFVNTPPHDVGRRPSRRTPPATARPNRESSRAA